MGGGPTHPAHTSLGKMALKQVWDLGNLTSSVSRRVVKLTVPRYYSAPLPAPDVSNSQSYHKHM